MEQYEWDGIERRINSRRDDDVLKQVCEMMKQMNREQIVYPNHEEKDISHSKIEMKDLWTIIGGLGSLLISCFLVWNDLHNSIIANEHQFELFKSTIEKTVESDDKTTDELKKKLSDIEMNIKELDQTINQLYNKINKTTFI